MKVINVIGGDFEVGEHYYFDDSAVLMIGPNALRLSDLLMSVDIVTEENQRSLGKKLVGGVAGGLLLGPIGAIGGMLYTGNSRQVTILMQFYDGQSALAIVTLDLAQELMVVAISASNEQREREQNSILTQENNFDPEEFDRKLWKGISAELVEASKNLEKTPEELGITHAQRFRRSDKICQQIIERHPGTYACEMFKEMQNDPEQKRLLSLDDESLNEELVHMDGELNRLKSVSEHNAAYPLGIPKYLYDEYTEASNQLNMHPSGSIQAENAMSKQQQIVNDIKNKYPDSELVEIIKTTEIELANTFEQAESKKGIFSKLFS